jgi:TatD DNase family protein
MYIDSHCHLTDKRLEKDLKAIIEKASERSIEGFLLAGTEPCDWQKQSDLKKLWPNKIFPVFGVHPWWVKELSFEEQENALKTLENRQADCVAIGETGLDYQDKLKESKEAQKSVFVQQIKIAQKYKKPLVLHAVRAHQDVLNTLKELDYQYGGLVHAYSAPPEIAEKYIEMGFLLSFGKALMTSQMAQKAFKTVSIDKICFESDAPDQPPPQWPEPLNMPWSIHVIAQKGAEITNTTPEKLLETSAQNLKRFFGVANGQ